MNESKTYNAPFLKCILTTLLTASTGLGMLYIYKVGLWWPTPIVLRYTWLAALGVVGGLLARWMLGGNSGALRFLTALFSVIGGLWAAAWVTGGYLGFEIMYFNHPYPDYSGLAELGIPWLTAVLALGAWQKSRERTAALRPEPLPTPRPELTPIPASARVDPIPVDKYKVTKMEQTFNMVSKKVDSWFDRIKYWWHSLEHKEVTVPLTSRVASEPMGAAAPAPYKPIILKPTAQTINRQAGRQRVIDSTAEEQEEEHRCPYCLEIVRLDDYRGVKVCHICGAYHHADCWDVTGSCRASHKKK